MQKPQETRQDICMRHVDDFVNMTE